MKKTKSVRPIWAMNKGVMRQRRSHEDTKTRKEIGFSSCFRVFVVAFSVGSHRVLRAPVGRERATSFSDMRLVLVPEMLQRRQDRRHGGVAERAERLARDVGGDARQQIQI